jgi:hypothetical protein
MNINKIFLLCFVTKFIFGDNVDVWARLSIEKKFPYLVCLSPEANKNDKDKKKCEAINQSIRILRSILQERQLEINNGEDDIKNKREGDYSEKMKQFEIKKYYQDMRASYCKYKVLEDAYHDVSNLWWGAFRYHWIVDCFGLVSRLKATSFEKYINFIVEADSRNRIALEKIKFYSSNIAAVEKLNNYFKD